MNPGKAIEIKQKYQYILQDASLPELIEADNLSIEALRAITIWRISHDDAILMTLVGETKD